MEPRIPALRGHRRTVPLISLLYGFSLLLWTGGGNGRESGLSEFVAAAHRRVAAHQAQLKAQRERQRLGKGAVAARAAGPALNTKPLDEDALCARLGIPSLRPFQRQVLTHLGVLGADDAAIGVGAGRREVLAVQPTGAGKSVCFQAAATLPGTTLVVSPLLSLMFDQVASLKASGLRVATLNSMQSEAERKGVMDRLEAGELDLLYASPEQLDKNQKLVRTLCALPVPLLAIDEAHCISLWGHDFRPSYRRLGHLRETLGIPRLVALTASAPPIVRDDIATQLGMAPSHMRLVASCRRPNIELSRVHKSVGQVLKLLSPARARPALVYTQTRTEVEKLASQLALELGNGRTLRYHAGLTASEREDAQEAFLSSADGVMVATNAFGMGIDKADIRSIVHYGPPGSIEAYYQELGRGGRDGAPCRAVLMKSPQAETDLQVHHLFLSIGHPRFEEVSRVWRTILALGSADDPTGDLTLACSVKELEFAIATTERRVVSTPKCVRILQDWGLLKRCAGTTTVCLRGDAELRTRLVGDLKAGAGAELSLPPGLRKGTHQAKAWRVLAARVLRLGDLTRSEGEQEDGDSAKEVMACGEYETETLKSWGAEVGLEPKQFINSLKALQIKGFVVLDRSASLLLSVSAAARRAGLPAKGDERRVALEKSRRSAIKKLQAVEVYMGINARKGADENDELWRYIMRYFGEE